MTTTRATPTRARTAPRPPREHAEQSAFFTFIRSWAHRHPNLRWVHASLNGVRVTPSQARKAKEAGMVAGVWDISCPFPNFGVMDDCDGDYRGLYIEMKAGKNGLTEQQEQFREVLSPHRYYFRVCRSWIEAARCVGQYLGITDPDYWNALKGQR